MRPAPCFGGEWRFTQAGLHVRHSCTAFDLLARDILGFGEGVSLIWEVFTCGILHFALVNSEPTFGSSGDRRWDYRGPIRTCSSLQLGTTRILNFDWHQ